MTTRTTTGRQESAREWVSSRSLESVAQALIDWGLWTEEDRGRPAFDAIATLAAAETRGEQA